MPGSWLQRKRQEASSREEQPDTGPEETPSVASLRGETERERQLHGLAILSLFLHSTATVEEMMGMVLDQAPTVTGAVFVYPLLLERKRQLLRASMLEGSNDPRFEAAMDAFQEDLTAVEFSLVQNHNLYRVLETGEVTIRDGLRILFEDVLPEEQWKPAEETLGIKRVALVPMVVENEHLGMVVFAFDHDQIDVEALELLVGHLTLGLRDLLVRDEAVRFSDVDPVTWVYNRRYLMQAIQNEITRAGRYGRGLSLVAFDIDNFRQFNANYGQSMGDRLLRTFATTLAETVSPPEIVARSQDDEFVVLLPETNRAAAVTATTRLLASLSQVSVFSGSDEDGAEPVTASVAIACFPEDAGTPQGLMERALQDLASANQDRERETRPRGEDESPARAASG